MEKKQFKLVIGKLLVLLFTLGFSLMYAQAPGPADVDLGELAPVPGDGGAGGVGPGEVEQVSINMYEGLLLGVAVIMIITYYYNKTKRKIVNL